MNTTSLRLINNLNDDCDKFVILKYYDDVKIGINNNPIHITFDIDLTINQYNFFTYFFNTSEIELFVYSINSIFKLISTTYLTKIEYDKFKSLIYCQPKIKKDFMLRYINPSKITSNIISSDSSSDDMSDSSDDIII